eukprot:NODE_1382_length_1158_cov_375.962829.p1 GENE.NODE_1382_length_1158_cov_375.962829~~NODE_1382_length_1158_cov_375.962829.p1  ORF type:complete len:328 (+),score=76.24 NODE_1382_length_1158_cov_375.962829:3-986(+)
MGEEPSSPKVNDMEEAWQSLEEVRQQLNAASKCAVVGNPAINSTEVLRTLGDDMKDMRTCFLAALEPVQLIIREQQKLVRAQQEMVETLHKALKHLGEGAAAPLQEVSSGDGCGTGDVDGPPVARAEGGTAPPTLSGMVKKVPHVGMLDGTAVGTHDGTAPPRWMPLPPAARCAPAEEPHSAPELPTRAFPTDTRSESRSRQRSAMHGEGHFKNVGINGSARHPGGGYHERLSDVLREINVLRATLTTLTPVPPVATGANDIRVPSVGTAVDSQVLVPVPLVSQALMAVAAAAADLLPSSSEHAALVPPPPSPPCERRSPDEVLEGI